ncbi:MAG: alanine dehydrogenase [Syntrophales bacterium]|nr:alanine dehydrogenase [Syntrophales bacterium]
MIIGVLKEIKEAEHRVALTPAGVRSLTADSHQVLVERGAGTGSCISDEEYVKEGARVVEAGAIYETAGLIVKVKEPLPGEWPLYHRGQILFTYLHLASSEKLTRGIVETGVTGIAYETVQNRDGRLPLLTPMSEVAGRMSIQMAMHFLEKSNGGRGILLSGVPGVMPAQVVIIGAGIAGFNAAMIACGLGAMVTILDISYERLKYIDEILHGRAVTLFSSPYTIEQSLSDADLLIGAVLVTGARAPVLVTEKMVSRMKPGSVIIDISIDQGGSVETIRPTTHTEPLYTVHGVLHCGVTNIPSAVPRTSTFALTNATLPYIREIAGKGLYRAAIENDAIARGINIVDGKLTHQAIAETFDMGWAPWQEMLDLQKS